jgi:hypothetical protein
MTIDELKRHPYYPLRRFRSDDLAFLLLELYWVELFRGVLSETPKGGQDIVRWEPQCPADREEGNQIFHVADRSVSPPRALRIVQRFNTEGLPELDLPSFAPLRFARDAYVAFVPDPTVGATDDDGMTPIEELVVASDVSEPCERFARTLIRQWCLERVSVAVMRSMLDAYWTRVRQPDRDCGR